MEAAPPDCPKFIELLDVAESSTTGVSITSMVSVNERLVLPSKIFNVIL